MRRFALGLTFCGALLVGGCSGSGDAVDNSDSGGPVESSDVGGSRTINGIVVEAGAELAGANLSGADLSGAYLVGINLAGADLKIGRAHV